MQTLCYITAALVIQLKLSWKIRKQRSSKKIAMKTTKKLHEQTLEKLNCKNSLRHGSIHHESN